eukprot:TRINITY_DN2008_c0_g1_i3.p1 TRINITY_DN2008_c0_g1~~TRINITY_DN2008_c0_g1_i3.p1  ORF type:complete len:1189 (+),score=388.93 TRINITY_DN2008_c0_g1_i3:47-3568(+)
MADDFGAPADRPLPDTGMRWRGQSSLELSPFGGLGGAAGCRDGAFGGGEVAEQQQLRAHRRRVQMGRASALAAAVDQLTAKVDRIVQSLGVPAPPDRSVPLVAAAQRASAAPGPVELAALAAVRLSRCADRLDKPAARSRAAPSLVVAAAAARRAELQLEHCSGRAQLAADEAEAASVLLSWACAGAEAARAKEADRAAAAARKMERLAERMAERLEECTWRIEQAAAAAEAASAATGALAADAAAHRSRGGEAARRAAEAADGCARLASRLSVAEAAAGHSQDRAARAATLAAEAQQLRADAASLAAADAPADGAGAVPARVAALTAVAALCRCAPATAEQWLLRAAPPANSPPPSPPLASALLTPEPVRAASSPPRPIDSTPPALGAGGDEPGLLHQLALAEGALAVSAENRRQAEAELARQQSSERQLLAAAAAVRPSGAIWGLAAAVTAKVQLSSARAEVRALLPHAAAVCAAAAAVAVAGVAAEPAEACDPSVAYDPSVCTCASAFSDAPSSPQSLRPPADAEGSAALAALLAGVLLQSDDWEAAAGGPADWRRAAAALEDARGSLRREEAAEAELAGAVRQAEAAGAADAAAGQRAAAAFEALIAAHARDFGARRRPCGGGQLSRSLLAHSQYAPRWAAFWRLSLHAAARARSRRVDGLRAALRRAERELAAAQPRAASAQHARAAARRRAEEASSAAAAARAQLAVAETRLAELQIGAALGADVRRAARSAEAEAEQAALLRAVGDRAEAAERRERRLAAEVEALRRGQRDLFAATATQSADAARASADAARAREAVQAMELRLRAMNPQPLRRSPPRRESPNRRRAAAASDVAPDASSRDMQLHVETPRICAPSPVQSLTIVTPRMDQDDGRSSSAGTGRADSPGFDPVTPQSQVPASDDDVSAARRVVRREERRLGIRVPAGEPLSKRLETVLLRLGVRSPDLAPRSPAASDRASSDGLSSTRRRMVALAEAARRPSMASRRSGRGSLAMLDGMVAEPGMLESFVWLDITDAQHADGPLMASQHSAINTSQHSAINTSQHNTSQHSNPLAAFPPPTVRRFSRAPSRSQSAPMPPRDILPEAPDRSRSAEQSLPRTVPDTPLQIYRRCGGRRPPRRRSGAQPPSRHRPCRRRRRWSCSRARRRRWSPSRRSPRRRRHRPERRRRW